MKKFVASLALVAALVFPSTALAGDGGSYAQPYPEGLEVRGDGGSYAIPTAPAFNEEDSGADFMPGLDDTQDRPTYGQVWA